MLGVVRDSVARHRLIGPGERVLVAVSGGPDSVALLHLLLRLSDEWDLALHAFHMDHGLRADSAADAAFVARLTGRWGVRLTTVSSDVRARRRPGESLQQAARRVRYAAMRRAAEEAGAARIALGHHADDQAETVLMRFLRGSGAKGLGGMRRRRGPFIRPLLDVSRAEIEAYCAAFRLEVRRDPSNLAVAYLRNKVRLELMPLLRAEYNPNIRLALNRTAALLQDDDDLLDLLAYRAFQRLRRAPGVGPKSPDDAVVLPVGPLARQPRSLRRRIVRHAVRYAARTWAAPSFDHVQAVLALLDEDSGTAVDLPGRVRVRRRGDALVFKLRSPGGAGGAGRADAGAERDAAPAYEIPLAVPGRTVIPGNKVIHAAFIDAPPAGTRPGPQEAWMDWEKLSPPLTVRTWRPGDRMRPLGLGGTKKLQDLFVDEKIPAPARRRLPVVADADGVVWVSGRVDERAAVTPSSRRVLRLRIASL